MKNLVILIFRGNIHNIKIQCNQCIHDTHITTGMTAISFHDHIDNILS